MIARLGYKRVVLSLHHDATDREVVQAAAELALLFGLDLHGIFVEDEEVLGLADLPFAREIRLPTHEWAPLSAEQVAREFEHTAEEIRRLLADVAGALGVSIVFERLRGNPITEPTAHIQPSDIFVVVEPVKARALMADRFLRLCEAAFRSRGGVMFLPPRADRRKGPIIVAARNWSDPTLELAARVAAAADEGLLALLPEAPPDANQDALKDRLIREGAAEDRIEIRTIGAVTQETIISTLGTGPARLLIVSRSILGEDGVVASQLAARSGVPVLVAEPEENTERIAS